MPPLKNIKHEKFAQRSAVGDETNRDIYQDVYQCSRECANKATYLVRGRPDVTARIEELVSAGANEAVLTIQAKRKFYKTVVDDQDEHTSNKIKASEADSKLAGHQGTMDNATTELLTKFASLLSDKISKE